MYQLTITERTPTEPEHKDLNSYHVICDNLLEVATKIENFALSYGCLVSLTVTPFEE